MVELIIIFITTILTMLTLKFQKKIMQNNYFYFGRLIDGFDEDISILGLIARILIPLLFGLLIGLASILLNFKNDPTIYGMCVGFFSAFLLVWPDFYNPELISWRYANKKTKLYVIYIIVMLLFTLLGLFGASLAKIAIQLGNLLGIAKNLYSNYIDPKAIINNLISSIIWAILAAFFMIIFTKLLNQLNPERSTSNKSDQSGTEKRDADTE
jgi:hypothetical protein